MFAVIQLIAWTAPGGVSRTTIIVVQFVIAWFVILILAVVSTSRIIGLMSPWAVSLSMVMLSSPPSSSVTTLSAKPSLASSSTRFAKVRPAGLVFVSAH